VADHSVRMTVSCRTQASDGVRIPADRVPVLTSAVCHHNCAYINRLAAVWRLTIGHMLILKMTHILISYISARFRHNIHHNYTLHVSSELLTVSLNKSLTNKPVH